MAAALAKGTTVLRNCAIEPEIRALIDLINAMGGSVEQCDADTTVVEGRDSLSGVVQEVMPDRIEAGTHVMAAAVTRGDIRVCDCEPEHLASLLEKLDEAGLKVELLGNDVQVTSNGRIKSRDVATNPYPGFATDFQAQYMALMALGRGQCSITKMSLRTASCTYKNWCVWGQPSGCREGPHMSPAWKNFPEPTSRPRICEPARVSSSLDLLRKAPPRSTVCTTWTGGMNGLRKNLQAWART